jgi:AcrR family transcriptional regulator
MTLPTATERRRDRPGDARDAVLTGARALLLEDGDEGFTIRKVAERCGYSAPTIYHHFRDKTGLIDAVLEEEFRELVTELAAVAPDAEPLETVRARIRFIVDFCSRNPTHYRLMSAVRPASAEPVPSAEETRLAFERPLEELAAAGRLRSADLETVKQLLWVLMHGLISLPPSRPEMEWSADLADLALDTMLRGLVRPAAPEQTR